MRRHHLGPTTPRISHFEHQRPGLTQPTINLNAATINILNSPMSELQKSFAKAKIAKLPPEAPMIPEQPAGGSTMQPIGESDNDSSDASSTATAVPSPTRQLFARPSRGCVLLLPPPPRPVVHCIVTRMLRSQSINYHFIQILVF